MCVGGRSNKAMDCSGRRVVACIAYGGDRRDAVNNLRRNHVHSKLIEGLGPAHSLDAKVAHSTKQRSDQFDDALHVSEGHG